MVEPNNTVLATHATMDHSDCAFMFDKQAVQGISHDNLNIEQPTYTSLNRLNKPDRLFDHSFAAIRRRPERAPRRVQDQLGSLRIHFSPAAFAPVISAEKDKRQLLPRAAVGCRNHQHVLRTRQPDGEMRPP